MTQKPPDRRFSDVHLFLGQPCLKLCQRDIRLLRHPLPNPLFICCKSKFPITAKFGRTDTTCLAVEPENANDRADAHTKLLRSLRYGSTIVNHLDNAITQVLRIRFPHPCWPPPVGSLNHIRAWMEI